MQLFGSSVRVVFNNWMPWFVASDVCKCLGIHNFKEALASLEEDEKAIDEAENLDIISESGLYALIFRSRKPEAVQFTRWVTHGVLPAIHNMGKYMLPSDIERIIDFYSELDTTTRG